MRQVITYFESMKPKCCYANGLWSPVLDAFLHDDVIKWKHFPRHWPFVRGIHRSPVNSPHQGQWRGALMFSLICAWINGWVNNREAGDLWSHRTHYDVNVMLAFGGHQTVSVATFRWFLCVWWIYGIKLGYKWRKFTVGLWLVNEIVQVIEI